MAQDENRIKEILAGLAQPAEQPSLLQRILSSIPQAISVGFSQDPAQALEQQLNQRQQQIQAERERQQRIQQLGATLQIEDIIGRSKEKREENILIGREERAEKRLIGAEDRADIRDIANFNRQSGFQEKLQNISFDQNKQLASIKQGYELEINKTNAGYAEGLENLRSSNNQTEKRLGEELSIVMPLLYSGHVSGKEAGTIYEKIRRGEKLEAGENKALSKANASLRNEEYKRRLSLTYAANANRGGSEESLLAKASQWAMNKASTNNLGLDASGQVQEVAPSMLAGGAMTLPDGSIPKKLLNEDEQYRYYFDYSRRTMGVDQQQQPGVTSDITTDKAKAAGLDSVIQALRGQKIPPEQIIQSFNSPETQQRYGVTPQQVQEAIQRNQLTSVPGNVLQQQLNEVDSEIRRLEGTKQVGRGPSLPVTLSSEDSARRRELVEQRVRLTGRIQKEATIDFIRVKLEQAEAGRAVAITQAKKGRLDAEIKDLKARLEFSRGQLNK